MQGSASWLTKLKATELHRLATLIGTPCSGTKPVITKGIKDALSSLAKNSSAEDRRQVDNQGPQCILSIDMGIRNLAYSLWKSPAGFTAPEGYLCRGLPTLQAWKKVDISTSKLSTSRPEIAVGAPGETDDDDRLGRESFEPIDYADRAYTLVQHLLHHHNPSHILIERQRFRSGGNANVQEWTIRVGVFEGMLYAVLRTLAAGNQHGRPFIVEPVLPARINRYWFQPKSDSMTSSKAKKNNLTGREMKRAKIELVQKQLHLAMEQSQLRLFDIHQDVLPFAQNFTGKPASITNGGAKLNERKMKEDQATMSSISKRDDLADSLLQGLTWLHWQNNRHELQTLKEKAFDQSISHER